MQTIFHDPEIQQLNILDNRYYTADKGLTFWPSVTTILEIYPKGFGFNQWLKDVGNNAAQIADRAGELGTKIHRACEVLNNGQELTWMDNEGKGYYTVEEWEMVLNYQEFWKLSEAKLITHEKNLCSPKLKYGGTLDIIAEIDGKYWLIDIKTSNYIHKSHELQVAAYAKLWNEQSDRKIENTGILWLKAGTRTVKKDFGKNIIQGSGWQLKTFERHYEESFKIFLHTQAIWLEENPTWKPANMVYPDRIKLNGAIA